MGRWLEYLNLKSCIFKENSLAFFHFHGTMVLHSNWRYLLWLIRSVLLVSAAALALMLAPWALSPRAMIVTSSTPTPAWTAVLAAIPVPTVLSAPLSNQENGKESDRLCRSLFLRL